jgi:hypothetical protein
MCVVSGLVHRLILNTIDRTVFFRVAIITHFFLFCFVIFTRYSMIRVVGEVEKLMGREMSLFCYMVRTRIGLLLFSGLILALTLLSFEISGAAALILW